MTPQESQMLEVFLSRLAEVHSVTKDPAADAMIHRCIAAQPDAHYLLVQRALLLETAVDNARGQIESLQQQIQQLQQQQGESGTGRAGGDVGGARFLGGADDAGGRRSAAMPEPGFGRAAVAPNRYDPRAAAMQGVPVVQRQPYPQSPSQQGWRERLFGGGGGSAAAPVAAAASSGPGFLGTAASTAAGVAGGMFLFSGLQNLMDHHGSGGAGTQGFLNGGRDGSDAPATAGWGDRDPGEQARLDQMWRSDRSEGSGASDAAPRDAFLADGAGGPGYADDAGADFSSDSGGGGSDDDGFI